MIVTSLDALAKLSKDELWKVVVDTGNSADIKDIAAYKWLALNERDHQESMARMRALLRQSGELLYPAQSHR